MSHHVDPRRLVEWCRIPADRLVGHPGLRVPFRMVEDARELGRLMARELVDLVAERNAEGRPTRVIVPCGPTGWYDAWTELVNGRGVSLASLSVFHMDECLDWQGQPLPKNHPYNFRSFMERRFYGGIRAELSVPEAQRFWLLPESMERVREALAGQPADLTLGGWGQDGHVAYNQPRRHPLSHVSLDELADSTIRVQENTADTILALAHRTLGTAYQLVPPMSVTLGLRECLGSARVRVFSDTGSWKQTALRVALFSEPVAEYPITLLQRHRDALVTATRETARHPIAENPDWELP